MPKHTYPPAYPPGTHWAVDIGWECLDRFEPGVIPDEVRFMLAGMITGLVLKMEADPGALKHEWELQHGQLQAQASSRREK